MWSATTALGSREKNEDRCAESSPEENGARADHPIAVVCDGVGDHYGSGEAAAAACAEFLNTYRGLRPLNVESRMRSALDVANGAVNDVRMSKDGLASDQMATTLAAASVSEHGMSWIAVGHSRVHIWRAGPEPNGRLELLNTLHNRPANRHVVTTGITGGRIDEVSRPKEAWTRLEPGDIVLLSTDGIATLGDEDIAEAITTWTRRQNRPLSMHLVEAVLDQQAKGQDNVTVATAWFDRAPRE